MRPAFTPSPGVLLRRGVLLRAAAAISLSIALAAAQDPGRREALDEALRSIGQEAPAAAGSVPQPGSAAAAPPGQSGVFRLIDVSFDILTAVGTSTERDEVLQNLQGGQHDPRARGFTLQNAELALLGAVDPYFTAEVNLVSLIDPVEGETIFELEEAFLTTTCLPAGLQVEAGQFFTEFGRINPNHPHVWDWQDQPVINSRLFGADGIRGPGARLAWLLPTEQFVELHLGAQNPRGETMTSFAANDEVYAERPVAGRFFVERETRTIADVVWLGRVNTSFDSGSHSFGLGASVLFGPNATGNDGETLIAGADLVYRWRPARNTRGWPFVKVQGELLARRFRAAAQVDENDPADPTDDVAVPAATVEDWGFYLQGLYGFAPGWVAGLRGEYASGSGASYDRDSDTLRRAGDIFRADRLRLSPLLAYHFSELSRVRLQYNFDHTDALAGDAHSVWLGFEVSIGVHPAHKY